MGNVLLKICKFIVTMCVPFGDLLTRATLEKGSLDKWWSILVTLPAPMPPFNIISMILHVFGFIEDGKKTPFDPFMIIPVIVKLMVMLCIWFFYQKGGKEVSKLVFLLGLMIPFILTFVPLFIRSYDSCPSPASPGLLNVGTDVILCNALATILSLFVPYVVKCVPVVGTFLDTIPKPVLIFAIWSWTYMVSYSFIAMVNNHNDTSFCSNNIDKLVIIKGVFAFIQVTMLVILLYFKDDIYKYLGLLPCGAKSALNILTNKNVASNILSILTSR